VISVAIIFEWYIVANTRGMEEDSIPGFDGDYCQTLNLSNDRHLLQESRERRGQMACSPSQVH